MNTGTHLALAARNLTAQAPAEALAQRPAHPAKNPVETGRTSYHD
jgi:hypothetical protein